MRLSTREYVFLTIGGFVLLAVAASEMPRLDAGERERIRELWASDFSEA